MTDTTFDGRCLCGKVAVSIERKGAITAICHCLHCQKQRGSAFSTVLIAPVAAVTVTWPLQQYDDEGEGGEPVFRLFCPHCGSPVQTRSAATDAAGLTVIKAGLLDGGAPEPTMQVFCKRVVGWLPELPGPQRFDANPPLGSPS